MQIRRHFTSADENLYDGVAFREYLTHDDELIIVPAHWGDEAASRVKSHFLSRELIPTALCPEKVDDPTLPAWLCPKKADISVLETLSAPARFTRENDVRTALDRVVGGVTYQLWGAGVFNTSTDARAFYDELRFVILYQMMMPESVILQNTGLHWAYGVTMGGEGKNIPTATIGRDVSDLSDMCHATGAVGYVADAPEFANGFGFGGATIMPWLKLFEQARQCVNSVQNHEGDLSEKSRIFLDMSHPESLDFIRYRQKEDEKQTALSVGRNRLEQHLQMIMDSCNRDSVYGFDPVRNPVLKTAVQNAKKDGVSDGAIQSALLKALNGDEDIKIQRDRRDVCGEEDLPQPAFKTTVRLDDQFIEHALMGYDYPLTDRDGDDAGSINAGEAWHDLAEANWACGDPNVFFADTVNAWNTCAVEKTIKASDAQGGLCFFDGVSAPTATLNLMPYLGMDGHLDVQGFEQTCTLATILLDATIPDGVGGCEYRPLNIGFTGVAPYLMGCGLSYDAPKSRSLVATISAMMTGAVYQTSTQLAEIRGTFPQYPVVKKSAQQVLENHLAYLEGDARIYHDSVKHPALFQAQNCPDSELLLAAKTVWTQAVKGARQYGLRNAQATSVMEMVAENDMLSSGGLGLAPAQDIARFEGFYGEDGQNFFYGRKLNDCVVSGLKSLGYGAGQIDDIHFYVTGHGSLFDAPVIDHERLKKIGFCQAQFDALEQTLKSALDIRYAFNPWVLGHGFCEHTLGFHIDEMEDPEFDMLTALGFTEDEINTANLYCCGTMTLKGAPHIRPEHEGVFDYNLSPLQKIDMMAAVQPFLSGGIGHTVHVPVQTTSDDIRHLYKYAWEKGVKHVNLYREQSGFTNPSVLPMAMVLEPYMNCAVAHNDVHENLDEGRDTDADAMESSTGGALL